jgi:hypothetical protein
VYPALEPIAMMVLVIFIVEENPMDPSAGFIIN